VIHQFRTIVVLLIASAFITPAYSFYNFSDSSAQASCIDPVICQLDSMSLSMFTRDRLYIDDASVLNSINMPYDAIPKYTSEEMQEKMKLIPSLIPLNYNNTVRQFIEFFAYRRRALMASCIANSQLYFPVMEEILDRKGLPLELKYLPIIESAFNPVAVSRAGATGLWQLMYGTGAQLGLNINSYVDERRDPVKATAAAADYLKKLYDFYGDWQLVLAAYNSGPGTVNKAIARAGGVKNFWAILNYLPAETRSYVPTYIAMAYVMNYYQDYKLVSAEPKRTLYAVDTVLISAKVSLKHISDVLGIPVDELQFLNPSLKAGVIPYTEKGYGLNLPMNYFALFEARQNDIMVDSSQMMLALPLMTATTKTIWYKVKNHETMAKIAAHYSVTESSIKKWNKLKNSYVYAGQKLKLVITTYSNAEAPGYAQAFSSKVLDKSRVDTIGKASTSGIPVTTADENADTTADSTTAATTTVEDTNSIKLDKSCNCVYHVVQPGDTLWSIAKHYEGITIDKLKSDNKEIQNRPIKVGDVIKILM
jgi:membrane-bound lytic murein transglycosylase D